MFTVWTIGGICMMTVLSIYDLRTKKIPILGFVVVLVYSILSLVCFGTAKADWMAIGTSLIPGLLLMGLSVITEGRIGMGDGLLIAILGIGLGTDKCVFVLAAALILNCIVAGILLMLRRVSRRSCIPFVPFITAGMGVVMYAFR